MKKLAKAQYGKVLKVAAKRAADAVVRKKDMANKLKTAAALGAASGSWLAIDSDIRKKKTGIYNPQNDSLINSKLNKKKTGGSVKTKKK
jgi:hypothetical protein